MHDASPPGFPGIPAKWTSSAKSGVGTSVNTRGRVWFALSHGIVNEVYYPRIDQANTRDFGFLVADGKNFFSEENRDADHQIEWVEPGVPAYRLTNTCKQGYYRISKTIVPHPRFDVLLQQVTFRPLQGCLADYALYALLAPHIGNHGSGNSGWIGAYKEMPMMFAERDGTTLALACSASLRAMSCGYVGFSDGWQDVRAHKRMTWRHQEARNGNIALTAEIDITAPEGKFVIALGFGRSAAEAALQARASLLENFGDVLKGYVAEWQGYQDSLLDIAAGDGPTSHLYRVSTAVLKTHAAKDFPGGMIASLSIPWGVAKGDDDLGGYHLVWPRDMVESAGGLLAAGDTVGALRVLLYLMATQEADGHWPQNMWLDGTPYWFGIQMDETAFPILLADSLRRMQALGAIDPWPMIRKAAGFLALNGPVTGQDRWEEDGGYSPFTLAVEIAGLLAAADFADAVGNLTAAHYLRHTADYWNAHIESWTYVSGTELARQVGVEGYYVRIASPEVAEGSSPATACFVPIKNRPPGESTAPKELIVSPDALALVRFGLRAADDPRIVNTVKVIDSLLRTATPTGPVWHRYNRDGYGEHDNGAPFDGTGIGRGWPLLAGERAHYELAKNDRESALRLLQTLGRQTSPGGFIPEQIWDAADIPALELIGGQPSGSAMPLVWAHAEYIKLLRSLRDGHVFDMPPQTVQRYQKEEVTCRACIWSFNHKLRSLPRGKNVRIELTQPALVHWSTDAWQSTTTTETADSGLGLHFTDLPVRDLPPGTNITFTMKWLESSTWEGRNFQIVVQP